MPTSGAYEFRLAAKAVDHSIPRDHIEYFEPGEWAWIYMPDPEGWLLMHRCPDCKEMGTLWAYGKGHTIDQAGNVTPSVLHGYKVCGVEKCGFHTQPTRLLDFVDKRGKEFQAPEKKGVHCEECGVEFAVPADWSDDGEGWHCTDCAPSEGP